MFRLSARPLLLATLALGLIALPALAQTNPCAPGYGAIHDFKVGDVFQYRIWKGPSDNVLLYGETETIRKYRITSRRDSGATLIYGIEGHARITDSENGRKVRVAYAPILETLRFTPSPMERLNRCHGDIVPYPEFQAGMHTKVEIVPAEIHRFSLARPGQRLKILGNPIGTRQNDSTLSILMDVYHTMTYAEGLGLVGVAKGGGFPGRNTHTEELMGYTRDGQTFGHLTPDAELTVSIRRDPARQRAAPSAGARAWKAGPGAIDLRGRRLALPAGSIDLSAR